MDEKTLLALEQQSEAGDANAAYRIAVHYSFGVHEDAKAVVWLRRSLELGNLHACGGLVAFKATPLPDACKS